MHTDDAPAWMHHAIPDTIDQRIIDQDRHWITRNATILTIDAMSTDHLRNVLDLVLRQALDFHTEAMVDALHNLLLEIASGDVPGEYMTRELTRRSVSSYQAHEWIETTPLVRALRRELAAREKLDTAP